MGEGRSGRQGYIVRQSCLEQLEALREKPVVKLLTGIRGSGKTTILAAFAEGLRQQGIPSEQIVELNFDDLRYGDRVDCAALHYYIEETLREGKHVYLFLDEMERAAEFEQVVGRLYLNRRLGIYMASSHRSILTGELATVFSGGFAEVPVLPLSLAEYRQGMAGVDGGAAEGETGEEAERMLAGWLRDGGLPQAVRLSAQGFQAADYLEGLFHTVLVREILERYPLRDFSLLKEMMCHVCASQGEAVSPASVASFFKEQGRKVSAHTTGDYLRAMTEAGLLYWMPRRDLKTGQMLQTSGKYYLSDMGLRNLLMPKARTADVGAMENLVYLELRRQGFSVTAGKLGGKTIDFVAERKGERMYFQLAAEDLQEEKLHALLQIRDQYPKYILDLGEGTSADRQGVRGLGVKAFLEKPAALF